MKRWYLRFVVLAVLLAAFSVYWVSADDYVDDVYYWAPAAQKAAQCRKPMHASTSPTNQPTASSSDKKTQPADTIPFVRVIQASDTIVKVVIHR